MIKQAPSPLRIITMVAFALSCFALLIFLWISFGGPIPLRPKKYEVTVEFPEAATLVQQADVRLAGVNVGKVLSKEIDRKTNDAKVVLSLDSNYAPIPADTRATLRQKTLLGETYVELSPGRRYGSKPPMVPDGGTLPAGQVQPTVELDEIFSAFDRPTRLAVRQWLAELRKVVAHGRSRDLNDVFGNLSGFAVDGATVLRVLDEQQRAVRGLVHNTGVVFGAINERQGALRDLISNANETFAATASRDAALADTFRVFPTFLRESRSTLARLQGFSQNARPVVRDLQGPADDLGPTVHDLAALSPDLQQLLRNVNPLVRSSVQGVPDLQGVLKGARPLVDRLNPFLAEFNPILSLLSFNQNKIATFFAGAGPDLSGHFGGQRYQTNVAMIDPRSLQYFTSRPAWDRGTAYPQPNTYPRAYGFGTFESLDCKPAGGEQRDPVDAVNLPPLIKDGAKRPPCFVMPRSIYDDKVVQIPQRGVAPNVRPQNGAGTPPIPSGLH